MGVTPRTKFNGFHQNLRKNLSTLWDEEFDPFQVFEVEHEACLDFQIEVIRGENVTKGSYLKDICDTPDPYVILKIPGSSNSSHRTTAIDNSVTPLWNQTFHFYLDPKVKSSKHHVLHIVLMDANYTIDETLGSVEFNISSLEIDNPIDQTFIFPCGSKVFVKLLLQKNKTPDLRFSLALCEEEKRFLRKRRENVLLSLQNILGDKGPTNKYEVPVVAVLGSGGGFRAMSCLSGVIRALHESGILDCATYISGLSGSSWLISMLYAHSFPDITFDEVHKKLKDATTTNWKKHLLSSYTYVNDIISKYRKGQPVSFTDFFGHLLGDVLLKRVKHKKLTDQQDVVAKAIVPFPLYTCLHAKASVSCRQFSEWVEFSPYEIGIAKYGTFMKASDFGNKFLCGKKIKAFPEFPLHYLQGVWGSAFTILVKRLLMEGGNVKQDMVQMMREANDERSLIETVEDQCLQRRNSSDVLEHDSETDDEEEIVGEDDSLIIADDSNDDEKADKEKIHRENTLTVNDVNHKVLWNQSSDEADEAKFVAECNSIDEEQLYPFNEMSEIKENEETSTAKNSNSKEKVERSESSDSKKNVRLSSLKKSSSFFTFFRKSSNTEQPKKSDNGSSNVKISQSYSNVKSVDSTSILGFNFDFGRRKSKDETERRISTQSDPGSQKSSSPITDQAARKIRLQRQGAMKSSIQQHSPMTIRSNRSQQTWTDKRKSLHKERENKSSFLQSMMKNSNILNSRAGRAGEILNPFRGLSLRESFPLSPFTSCTESEQSEEGCGELEIGLGSRYEPLDNRAKKLFIVDSGLAFNSPYPLLLRPQRGVNVYLSFDFSQRPKDSHHPFKELLLAEKWALQNNVPFPPIEEQVEEFKKDKEVKELYIFKHPTNIACPVILHFPLVNNKFQWFKDIGVRRETTEELDFGDFSLFNDPSQPYASTNFFYTGLQYERLTKLCEFNTKLCIDQIKLELAGAVQRRIGINKKSMEQTAIKIQRLMKVKEKFKQKANNRINLKVNTAESDKWQGIIKDIKKHSLKRQSNNRPESFSSIITRQRSESGCSTASTYFDAIDDLTDINEENFFSDEQEKECQ